MAFEKGAQLLPETWIDRLEDRLSLPEDNTPELLVLLPKGKRDADGLSIVRRGSKGRDLGDNLMNSFI